MRFGQAVEAVAVIDDLAKRATECAGQILVCERRASSVRWFARVADG